MSKEWTYDELVEEIEYLYDEYGKMCVEMANTNNGITYENLKVEIETIKHTIERYEYMVEHWDDDQPN